jgi:phospholipid transport system transporter-binding protein
VLALKGLVTMATAGTLLAEGRAKVAAGNLTVDLSGITEADSAALALLFDWIRAARKAGTAISVQGMPEGLTSLASLYGVIELIPAGA